MRKIILLMLFMGITMIITAQDFKKCTNYKLAHFLTKLLVEETNGYISEEYLHNKEWIIISVGLPSFYNFDLIRMDVAKIMRSYSDINTIQQWSPMSIENAYSYGISIDNYDDIILISFNTSVNLLLISIKYKNDEKGL